MANPAVSIVIPTCDRPELLQRALASVFAQTFQDFEIIVVNDGSTPVVLSEPRIRCIKNETKKGAPGSRNVGIREARAAWIAFLDDDDQWVPEKLAVQLARLASAAPNTVFCFSAVRNVYNDHEEITNVPEGEMNFLELALRRFNGFLTSTLLVKKEALREVGGFDESLPSHQEPELVIRLSQHYDGIGIDEPLTCMSMDSSYEHIGSSVAKQISGREALLAKHSVLFLKRYRVLAKHYFQIGLWKRALGARKEARRYFVKAFSLSGNPRYALHALTLTFF